MSENLTIMDADTLLSTPMQRASFIIDGFLPQGVGILSGAPKIGKSWLMLLLSLKVSQGLPLWGMKTDKCDVLYLCLEDSFQRIQDRLYRLTESAPDNLYFAVTSGQIGNGLQKQIHHHLKEYPATRLIIIDTLQKVRNTENGNKGMYAADYDDSNWTETDLFTSGWATNGLNTVNGSHWFRKDFQVSAQQAGEKATLRLGCIVDADSVYVNGTFVGTVSYQYPPRIYTIPAGLLKAGKNTITIRLFSYGGRPQFVKEKPYKILFGKGHELTVKKMLSQPGQFACEEKVEVVGPKSSLKMSVLGPVRKDTQVEVSLTDARAIGVTAPIRESGDIAGSGACKLVGPAGEVELTEGVIAAKRHVHMTPEDAEAAGVKDKDIVKLDIQSPNGRSLTFGDVVVRVSASYATAAHIDTDEANALCPGKECYGEMIK